MRLGKLLFLIATVLLAGVSPCVAQVHQPEKEEVRAIVKRLSEDLDRLEKILDAPSREETLAIVKQLHKELDGLEVAGEYEKQLLYFADDVIRMDPNRPVTRGKEAWLKSMKGLHASGFKVVSANTSVTDAWQVGDRIYEYGSCDLQIQIPGSGVVSDPINYFAIVDMRSKPRIEFIIWNTAKPIDALKTAARPTQ